MKSACAVNGILRCGVNDGNKGEFGTNQGTGLNCMRVSINEIPWMPTMLISGRHRA